MSGTRVRRRKLTGILLVLLEELVDLVANLAVGHADIILGLAIVGHEGEETIVGNVELSARVSFLLSVGSSDRNCQKFAWGALVWSGAISGFTYQLVLLSGDVGNVHVVGGGGEIFVLLGGEDIDGNKMDLGVTVLASLGGGHVDNLAGTVLDDDETVLSQSRALHGVGQRSAGIGRVEGNIVVL